jgi:hypothetical protein
VEEEEMTDYCYCTKCKDYRGVTGRVYDPRSQTIRCSLRCGHELWIDLEEQLMAVFEKGEMEWAAEEFDKWVNEGFEEEAVE